MATTPKDYLIGILIACVVAVVLQLVFFSPCAIQIPPPSSLLPAPSNGKLQEVIKLGEGLLKPEDVAVDKLGALYTATRDGSIKRLHKNGTLENWCQTVSESFLGVTMTAAGDLIVCDAEKGLLKVDKDGVTVLASHVNGAKIKYANNVIESVDGMLYFSVSSTKVVFHDGQLDVLEKKGNGQLLKYDPSSNVTSILLNDLEFANGVALSANQDYLVVCETWKHRCLKYWVEGDLKGQTEVFFLGGLIT